VKTLFLEKLYSLNALITGKVQMAKIRAQRDSLPYFALVY